MDNATSTKAAMDDSLLDPRPYQLEMFEESLKRNVIVAMETGSGKTHVAVLRIHHELQNGDSNKRIWFLAPKLALCEQQHEVLKKAFPSIEQQFLSGNDALDKWKTQALWDAKLLNVRIVVCTPQVLLDALTHGFVKMPNISLLIFDEAHHCTAKEPMNVIMSGFYLRLQREKVETPAILGLTASPVRKLDEELVRQIENNLDATIITPRLHKSDLMRYLSPPGTASVIYDISRLPEPPALVRLQQAYATYDIWKDPYVIQLKRFGDAGAEGKLQKVLRKRKTFCTEQLKSLLSRAKVVTEQLGSDAMNWFLEQCIFTLNRLCEDTEQVLLFDWRDSEVLHLQKILRWVVENESTSEPSPNAHTQKFELLLQILDTEASEDFKGIVFAEQRATVSALTYLLKTCTATRKRFRTGSYVGSSSYHSRKANISDLVDIKAQHSLLAGFREADLDLIVATNVLEEGIDVPACNLVVCFDAPQHLTSFVQRRGRARRRESRYILLIPSNPSKIEEWQVAERALEGIYVAENRALEVERSKENEEVGKSTDFETIIDSSGALLTLENAVVHLHHFCNTLRGQYFACKPTFTVGLSWNQRHRSANVILPSSLDPELRIFQSRQTWLSEKRAKQDAAFVACEALLDAKLLNHHILPATSDLEDSEIELFNLPSVLDVNDAFDPWLLISQEWRKDAPIVCTELVIQVSGQLYSSITVALPQPLPDTVHFSLYWDEQIMFSISVGKVAETALDKIDIIRRATRHLLQSVFPTKPIPDDLDFVLLFVPDVSLVELQTWIANTTRRLSATDVSERVKNTLVYDRTRSNVAHIASDVRHCVPSHDHSLRQDTHSSKTSNEEEVCVDLHRLPKLRNFLKPLRPGQASANTQYCSARQVPVRNCSTSLLPANFAIPAYLTPSITRHLKNVLIAEELRTSILGPVVFNDVELVLEAITASAAGEGLNYERLEHLGDCVLKLLASLHYLAAYPKRPEHQLSLLKHALVSNNSLADAAVKVGLDRFIIVENPREGKYRPLYVSEVLPETNNKQAGRKLSSKTIADVAESLIGASFLHGYRHTNSLSAGLDKAAACLRIFFPSITWQPVHEWKQIVCTSAQPSSNVSGCTSKFAPNQLAQITTIIGHTFRNTSLLATALTHASYNLDLAQQTYDRLEFLGDALLDFLVTTALFTSSPALPHDRMHSLREASVNAHILSYLCLARTISVKRKDVSRPRLHEGPTILDIGPSEHALWEYMQRDRMDYELTSALHKSHGTFCELRRTISEALETGDTYPWVELMAVAAPKCVSDIMESCIAAVWLDDSDGGTVDAAFDAVKGFLERYGLRNMLDRLVKDEVECRNPKERVAMLAKGLVVEYVRSVHDEDPRTAAVEQNSGDARGEVQLDVIIAGMALATITVPRTKRTESDQRTSVEYLTQCRLATMALESWNSPDGGAEVVQAELERMKAEKMEGLRGTKSDSNGAIEDEDKDKESEEEVGDEDGGVSVDSAMK